MKNKSKVVFSAGLVSALVLSGFNVKQQTQDIPSLLKSRIPTLHDLRVQVKKSSAGRKRLYCELMDNNGSQITVEATWEKPDYTFEPRSRQSWKPTKFSSGYALGKSMNVSEGDTAHIIGDRCEVSVMCLMKSEKKTFDRQLSAVTLQRIAPRVFGLIQSQALKELEIAHSYQVLDRAGLNISLDADECTFSISNSKGRLEGCIGSSDIQINGKKFSLPGPVLLTESGDLWIDHDFRLKLNTLR